MSDERNPGEVTILLRASAQGDEQARDKVIENMYGDLRRLAGRLMRAERPGHTLQATALVNELMLKMIVEQEGFVAENREHLLALASRAMRHLLVDHARGKRAGKRGGGVEDCEIQPDLEGAVLSNEKLLLIHDAMQRLQVRSERQAQVAEMRIFGGFSVGEIAQALGVTSRTVDRDWALGKAWLHLQLK